MQAILDEALEEYRRKKFWQDTNAALRALKRQKSVWKEEQQERAVWDNALLDGIEEE